MNVVDSSGWLEFYSNGPNKDFFKPALRDQGQLVVPVLTLYEVYKKILMERSLGDARRVTGFMEQGLVVDLTGALAKESALLSVEHKLPMADATILATAYATKATLWTQDADFEGLPGVKYIPRQG